MNDLPLVSIIVITYNSSKFILETLESAYQQSYDKLELIISDDFSTDNTIEICGNWVEGHSERFERVEIVKAERNTGIASNCNRGLDAAKGSWLKFIAGDDILLHDCITDFIGFINENPSAQIIVGGLILFNEKCNWEWFPQTAFQKATAKEQFRFQIRKGTAILGPATIIKRETLVNLRGFNENYQFIEDYPFYVKASQNNIKIFPLKKIIIRYRIHTNSISQGDNSKFITCYSKYVREVIYPLSFKEKMYFFFWHQKVEYYLHDRIKQFPFNSRFIRFIIVGLIDPYKYYLKACRLFDKI
ncbi:MAG: glycosyltransferase [Bacteroidetes bacterium]|nr:glycosyltransferase [Bacteroidota bacterium]